MRKLTLDEWENKYILDSIEKFDEKYTGFNRPGWDPDLKSALKDWSFVGNIKDKPGYTQLDQALRWASRWGEMIHQFNISKPNPPSLATTVMKTIRESNVTSMSLSYSPPEGVKIDANDTKRITNYLKKAATYFGADLVNFCKLDRRWTYSRTYDGVSAVDASCSKIVKGESQPHEVPDKIQYAIVLGFEEEYDMIKYFPSYIADAATSRGYSNMAITNAYLTAFIQYLGYKAINATNDVALSIPMAMQAGMGDIGRNGLLITPNFGPRLRLSKVITDLPLEVNSPIDFGVTEFCNTCGKCAEMCPSQAITYGERTTKPRNVSNVAGELKWPVDAEKCRKYWARSSKPCTACIACCPYNKPDTFFHRTVRWFSDNFRWADSFYVKMDNLFGYGKSKNADNFWDKWQPER